MTEQTKQASIEDLQREAQRAFQEVDQLTRRIGEIDQEIEAAREAISRERVAAAKRGESVATADRQELQRLQDERDELPEAHFVGRLRSAAAHIAVETARIREVEAEIPDAEAEHARLAQEAAEAQARAEAAWGKVNSLYGQRQAARERSKRNEQLMETIEAEGPRPLV